MRRSFRARIEDFTIELDPLCYKEELGFAVVVHFISLFFFYVVLWPTKILVSVLSLGRLDFFRTQSSLFVASSAYTKRIHRGRGSVIALSTMYRGWRSFYEDRVASRRELFCARFWDRTFWHSPALRYRLEFTIQVLRWVINKSGVLSVIPPETRGFVLSLGAGTSESTVKAIAENGHALGLVAVDISLSALTATERTAEELGFAHPLICKKGDAREIEALLEKGDGIDGVIVAVEVVGLFDYFPDDQIVDMLRQLYRLLEPGGYIVYSNVNPGIESSPIHRVVEWPKMYYRRARRLAKLTREAGFLANVYWLPPNRHNMVVAKKEPVPL